MSCLAYVFCTSKIHSPLQFLWTGGSRKSPTKQPPHVSRALVASLERVPIDWFWCRCTFMVSVCQGKNPTHALIHRTSAYPFRHAETTERSSPSIATPEKRRRPRSFHEFGESDRKHLLYIALSTLLPLPPPLPLQTFRVPTRQQWRCRRSRAYSSSPSSSP